MAQPNSEDRRTTPSKKQVDKNDTPSHEDGSSAGEPAVPLRTRIRNLLNRNDRAIVHLYRHAEVFEFDPDEVYAALERINRAYESQLDGLVANRLVVGGGDEYVAVALDGYEWYLLVQFIVDTVSDEANAGIITSTVLEVMAELAGDEWYCQYAVVITLPEDEVTAAVERQRAEFGTDYTGQWERV